MTMTLRSGVVTADTEYGMALLDQNSGEYFTLNPTAALIVRTLLDGTSREQAVTALTDRYDVTAEQVEEDITRILQELRAARLLAA
ncbi:PqqD family protein of HPr-rel-A system [Streptomyces glaucescens]|jgi:PqqD family protein of HPr-rel-A system|uniref:lasso peptide biosynthesis PqqD family chaperone n=1 Tax=unclassified Streptomyces TaxID=2593676 RepID=UPI000B2A1113|nr:lasso peptide biosynthesis PqqD family chaperone [Streptomyces sp. TSRI0107]